MPQAVSLRPAHRFAVQLLVFCSPALPPDKRKKPSLDYPRDGSYALTNLKLLQIMGLLD
jgi:hypothetical protein